MAYHLVSVGISAYKDPQNSLNLAADDAGAISSLFRNSLGREITYDVLLQSNSATQIAIRSALNADELKNASKADTLIIYYSGHGTVGMDDKGKKEAYLVPFDGDAANIAISGISTTELKELIDEYPHGNKIVLLDCCYSGGANSKGLSNIKHKDLAGVKAFQNQKYAEGTCVITACKESETAIEAPGLELSLFTNELVDELEKDHGDTVALSSVYHPVSESVQAIAKKHHHSQTPTLLLNSQGSMTLPKLSRPPKLKPEILKLPNIPGAVAARAPIPHFEISDSDSEKLVNNTVNLVQNANENRVNQMHYRTTVNKLFHAGYAAYLEQPRTAKTYDEVNQIIATLEAKTFQLLVTSAVVAITGDEDAYRILSEQVAQVLTWKRGQSGTTAVVDISDVLFLDILYTITVCAIYTSDYRLIAMVLNRQVQNWYKQDSFVRVVSEYSVHYSDSLGGNAKTVLQHVVGLLKTQPWLQDLLGVDENGLEELVVQANMCLIVAVGHNGERAYAGFNDYDSSKVMQLVQRIRTDDKTQEGLAALLNVPKVDVATTFAETVKKLNGDGSGAHWWHPLNPDIFTSPPA